MSAGEVDTAEVAFAGCEEVDKLQYMLYIKQLPSREARLAELALYRHNAPEAEAILLQVTPPNASKSHCLNDPRELPSFKLGNTLKTSLNGNLCSVVCLLDMCAGPSQSWHNSFSIIMNKLCFCMAGLVKTHKMRLC